MDARIRDQVIAEAEGNPLALLELPRGMTPGELAGGFGLLGAPPGQVPLTGRLEDSFRRRLDALPAETQRRLLLAAADPSGNAALVWRAAARLGLPVRAAAPAVDAGLAEFGVQVRFRHPLVRSVAYRTASFAERQEVHQALAEATDPEADPDRRAWHRAQAADGPVLPASEGADGGVIGCADVVMVESPASGVLAGLWSGWCRCGRGGGGGVIRPGSR
jgi:hypothetical protein